MRLGGVLQVSGFMVQGGIMTDVVRRRLFLVPGCGVPPVPQVEGERLPALPGEYSPTLIIVQCVRVRPGIRRR